MAELSISQPPTCNPREETPFFFLLRKTRLLNPWHSCFYRTSFCLPNPDCTQADAANEFTYVNGGYHVARRGMAMGSYEPVQNTTHIEAVRFLTSLGIEMTALAAKNSEHGIAVGSPIWHAEGVSSFVVEIL